MKVLETLSIRELLMLRNMLSERTITGIPEARETVALFDKLTYIVENMEDLSLDWIIVAREESEE